MGISAAQADQRKSKQLSSQETVPPLAHTSNGSRSAAVEPPGTGPGTSAGRPARSTRRSCSGRRCRGRPPAWDPRNLRGRSRRRIHPDGKRSRPRSSTLRSGGTAALSRGAATAVGRAARRGLARFARAVAADRSGVAGAIGGAARGVLAALADPVAANRTGLGTDGFGHRFGPQSASLVHPGVQESIESQNWPAGHVHKPSRQDTSPVCPAFPQVPPIGIMVDSPQPTTAKTPRNKDERKKFDADFLQTSGGRRPCVAGPISFPRAAGFSPTSSPAPGKGRARRPCARGSRRAAAGRARCGLRAVRRTSLRGFPPRMAAPLLRRGRGLPIFL